MQGKFTKFFVPHPSHLRHSSFNISCNISDNHREQRYLFLSVLACLSVYIWFGNKNKSNFAYKSKHSSFKKSSYEIIQSNKKAMPTHIIHEWAQLPVQKVLEFTMISPCCKWPFRSRTALTAATVLPHSHHLGTAWFCMTWSPPNREGRCKWIQSWASKLLIFFSILIIEHV